MPEKEEKQEHIVSIGIIPGSVRRYTHRYGRWWDDDKPWMGLFEFVLFLLGIGVVVLLLALVLEVLRAIG